MRHASLFTGIGGFDLAAEWMGWENVFQVEIDPFCQKVLEKNFPTVKRYGDIKQFDGTEYRGAVDILSGGFPCQKFSLSGKGTADLTEWKHMFRVVGAIRPAWVLAENVYGFYVRKKGLVFQTVCADLESIGYEVQAFIIPACAVGAPHQRDRVWIIAYSDREHSSLPEQQWAEGENGVNIRRQSKAWITSHSNGIGLRRESDRIGESRFIGKAIAPNDWQAFPTESPLCTGSNGLSKRLVRRATKAAGNAIVPQVAYEIFKAIDQVMRQREST